MAGRVRLGRLSPILGGLALLLLSGAAIAQNAVNIVFTNPYNVNVDQYLVLPDGQYQYYYTLKPGESINQPSYPGSTWTFGVNGTPLGNYVTTAQPSQAFNLQFAPPAAAAQPATAPAAQPPQGPAPLDVDGWSVQMVDFGSGAFVKLGDGQSWGEVNKKDWSIPFSYREVERSGTRVTLFDEMRKMHIAFDLPNRKVLFGYEKDGKAVNPLYNIASAAAYSRIPGSNTAWETIAPPSATRPATAAAAPAGGAGAPARPANFSCQTQKATLGPDKNQMSIVMGVCPAVYTDQGEYVVNFRGEQLRASRWTDKSRGQAIFIDNRTEWVAWVDSIGELHVAASTGKTRVGVDGAAKGRREQGPFMRNMVVQVAPRLPALVDETFPRNNMGSSFVSSSSGFTFGGSVGANAGHPMASGLNANLNYSYNDTQTTSRELEDFEVSVTSGSNDSLRIFTWQLCAVGTRRPNSNQCYSSPKDMMDRDFMGFAVPNMEILPKTTTQLDGFKNDVHYKITDMDTIRKLTTDGFTVDMYYSITTNTVKTRCKNSVVCEGVWSGTQTTMTYLMTFVLDLRELANIIVKNTTARN